MNESKVLVTGANGLLGQWLVSALLENSFAVIATGKGVSRIPFSNSSSYSYLSLDLENDLGWEDLFSQYKPDFVIHGGAMTQVDECETLKESCYAVNVGGTERLLSLASKHTRHFIFLSTDFVFDGKKGNYSEDDPVNPISWYGSTKLKAESFIQQWDIPWAIVRTCLVYGHAMQGTRSNIISWVKSKLEAGERIKVVSDQLRTPTYIRDLVRGILLVLKKRAVGIFHISGKDLLTPYDMALKTADFCGLDPSYIEKADAGNFTQPGKRPLRTGFVIDKARAELGFEPLRFEDGLQSMFPKH